MIDTQLPARHNLNNTAFVNSNTHQLLHPNFIDEVLLSIVRYFKEYLFVIIPILQLTIK